MPLARAANAILCPWLPVEAVNNRQRHKLFELLQRHVVLATGQGAVVQTAAALMFERVRHGLTRGRPAAVAGGVGMQLGACIRRPPV